LFGPNNSGKTNLAEAIDFISEAHRFGLELAIQRRGGFEAMAFRRMRRTKEPISFRVSARFGAREVERIVRERLGRPDSDVKPSRNLPLVVDYTFALKATSETVETDYSIANEHLLMQWSGSPRTERRVVELTRSEGHAEMAWPTQTSRSGAVSALGEEYPFGAPGFLEYMNEHPRTGLLIPAMRVNRLFGYFSDALSRMRVYQLSPLALRQPSVPTPSADLDRHGENLPSVISFMQKTHPEAWGRVLQAMTAVVPKLERITAYVTPDRRLSLKFYEAGVGRPWSPEEVSDGTMQSLALFTVVHDPRVPLVFVEEPENSVHAWILRHLIDACRKVIGKQVIMTSHSTTLLDQLSPREVSVVWRRDGRTRLQPLTAKEPGALEGWERGKILVSDLLTSGVIADAVPGASE